MDRFIPLGEAALNKDNDLPEESSPQEKASMSESESLPENRFARRSQPAKGNGPAREKPVCQRRTDRQEKLACRRKTVGQGKWACKRERQSDRAENSGPPKELTAESVGGAAAVRVLEGGMDSPLDAAPEEGEK